jgi:predicted RNase H-like HicB family nuclease
MELICYVERRGDQWVAQCLDFDIAVQGASFDEVKERIEGAIKLYLERVRELPEEERERFLHRAIPIRVALWMAVKVALSGLAQRLRPRDGNTPHAYNFPVHCHA